MNTGPESASSHSDTCAAEPTNSRSEGRLEKSTYTARTMLYRDFFGLLRVQAYFFTYHCNVKKRWIGRTLYDIFTTDFGRHSKTYVEKALAKGAFCVEFKKELTKGTKATICRDSQMLRFEPPVLPEWPKLLAETDELLVILKPPSMPLHPCGGYNELSIIPMLKKGIYEDWRHLDSANNEEKNSSGVQRYFGKWPFVRFLPFDSKGNTELLSVDPPALPPRYGLYIVHRLDRLTSGIVLLAKDKKATAKYSELLRSGHLRKIYVARASGRFPQFDSAPSTSKTEQNEASAESTATFPWIHPSLSKHLRYAWLKPQDTLDTSKVEVVGKTLGLSDEEVHTLKSKLSCVEERYQGLLQKIKNNEDTGRLQEVGDSQWLIVYGALHNVEPQRGIQGISTDTSTAIGDDYTDTHRKNKPGAAKQSITVFRILSYDNSAGRDGQSVVFCMPITGRTHQIRIHLQAIGYPISNDPFYWKPLAAVDHSSTDPSLDAAYAAVSDLTYEREAAEHILANENIDSALMEKHKEKSRNTEDVHSWKHGNPYFVPLSKDNIDQVEAQQLPPCGTEEGSRSDANNFAPDTVLGDLALELRGGCTLRGDINDFNVMQLQCMGIWLHACCYEHISSDSVDHDVLWSYTSPLPFWVHSPGISSS